MKFPNELMGGSELQYFNVKDIVPDHINLMLNHFVTDKNKINIHWQHQYHDQPSVIHIRDKSMVDKIDAFVFVSYHQKELFERIHSVPSEKSFVIRNAIWPISSTEKSTEEFRLIYTSTPFRGLEVLVGSLELILARNPSWKQWLKLDVFSSMKLYGASHSDQENNYRHLYDKCLKNPNINYHGVVKNEELREYLSKAHILAYPNTWNETSCIAAIEAMSAGVFPVISNLGALPETCSHYAHYYSPVSYDMYREEFKNDHIEQYSHELEYCIRQYRENGPPDTISDMMDQTNKYYSWDRRLIEWNNFFNNWRK